MKKKICIVGSGFFGIALALFLSKKYKVEIFEKKGGILNGASRANQLRFHLGYHYPRSKKTLKEVQTMNKAFVKYYGKEIFGKTENFYGIAKTKTKISFRKYLMFLKKNKLFYKLINKKKYFSKEISGAIICNEKNLNYFKIKKKIKKFLIKKKIKIYYNQEFKKKNVSDYYKIILACYDQNNNILKKIGIKPNKKFKYELVEKIIIKLPKKYKNKSFMVLDGKFVSLDPYLGTNYHLLSDVHYSKLEIIKDYYPNYKNYKKKFLNRGIIKNIKMSKFNNFIKNSSKYLPFLIDAKYIGSYFVTRVVEINKEKTDDRLNLVKYINNKIITVFSGKWNTSIGLASFLAKKI